jgi:hypothetical protein
LIWKKERCFGESLRVLSAAVRVSAVLSLSLEFGPSAEQWKRRCATVQRRLAFFEFAITVSGIIF